jgi:hypothetical protein
MKRGLARAPSFISGIAEGIRSVFRDKKFNDHTVH